MSVQIPAAGRTRHVKGSLYLERWFQLNTGTELLYGDTDLGLTGDLNTLDLAADSATLNPVPGSKIVWWGGASPGDWGYDRETEPSWYGQIIRVPFLRVQPTADWKAMFDEMQAFVVGAFPSELVIGPNRRLVRPDSSDVGVPAKYWMWTIEYD